MFNERQVLMLNKLLDEFEGRLTSSKLAKIVHRSADTTLHDIQDLIVRNVMKKEPAGGRSSHYGMVKFWHTGKLSERNFPVARLSQN